MSTLKEQSTPIQEYEYIKQHSDVNHIHCKKNQLKHKITYPLHKIDCQQTQCLPFLKKHTITLQSTNKNPT